MKKSLIALMALTVPLALGAQPAGVGTNSIGIVAGVSQFDLSGTGNAPVIGLRVDRVLHRLFLVEGALSAFRPDEQGDLNRTFFFPEAQVQMQWPHPTFRPYIGAGVGMALARENSTTEMTLSGAGGARLHVGNTVDIRAELRVRGIETNFTGSTAEWIAGFGFRF